MPIKQILIPIAITSLLAAAAVMAQTPYDDGQKALREQRWTEAITQFEEAVESDTDQADSATYWQAYALFKAGRDKEAERTLRRLERKYPDSRWVKEGQALRIEHQDTSQSMEQVIAGDEFMDDELRLFALSQLMDRNPERALPLVLDLVHNAESQKVQRDALFVLAMSEDPAVLEALTDFASNSNDPELQVSAIHILGSAGSATSLPLLMELYTASDDREVKRAVIQAHITSDVPAPLVKLFEAEEDPELRRSIIHALGAMQAIDELQSLYTSLNDESMKLAVIQAFAIAGDSSKLKQILDTETNTEIRRAAMFGIAMEGGSDTAGLLENLYDKAASIEEKEAILHALTIMDDASDLTMKIIRNESDPRLQRMAIQTLGINNATDQLPELYKSIGSLDGRKAVLEAMSIAGDTDGLITILESEQDENLRIAAINQLAITDSQAASQYLRSLYASSSVEEKSAIIQSMMILEDAQGLIGLIKQEDDPGLRKQMLQMLTLIDSEETNEMLFELLEKEG